MGRSRSRFVSVWIRIKHHAVPITLFVLVTSSLSLLIAFHVPITNDSNSYHIDNVCQGPESAPDKFSIVETHNFYFHKGQLLAYRRAINKLKLLEANNSSFSVACSTDLPIYRLYF